MIRVCETFLSINGETSFAGLPTYFIRLQGCSAHCKFCDTPYSQNSKGGKELDTKVIAKEVENSGCRTVCITGGEPLE